MCFPHRFFIPRTQKFFAWKLPTREIDLHFSDIRDVVLTQTKRGFRAFAFFNDIRDVVLFVN